MEASRTVFNFSVFPILQTERLLLRQILPADTSALFVLYHNPQVMQYRGAPEFSSQVEAEALQILFGKQFESKKGIRWGIVRKQEPDTLLGTAGIKNISGPHRRAEIGYELNPAYWNQGIMTEALRSITCFCFEKLSLHALEANIATDNLASARVLEKLEFVKEAHYRENWYYKEWWDSVIYTLHHSGIRALAKPFC
jgi:ribosomal-protein-alanine N-acetyltransferase